MFHSVLEILSHGNVKLIRVATIGIGALCTAIWCFGSLWDDIEQDAPNEAVRFMWVFYFYASLLAGMNASLVLIASVGILWPELVSYWRSGRRNSSNRVSVMHEFTLEDAFVEKERRERENRESSVIPPMFEASATFMLLLAVISSVALVGGCEMYRIAPGGTKELAMLAASSFSSKSKHIALLCVPQPGHGIAISSAAVLLALCTVPFGCLVTLYNTTIPRTASVLGTLIGVCLFVMWVFWLVGSESVSLTIIAGGYSVAMSFAMIMFTYYMHESSSKKWREMTQTVHSMQSRLKLGQEQLKDHEAVFEWIATIATQLSLQLVQQVESIQHMSQNPLILLHMENGSVESGEGGGEEGGGEEGSGEGGSATIVPRKAKSFPTYRGEKVDRGRISSHCLGLLEHTDKVQRVIEELYQVAMEMRTLEDRDERFSCVDVRTVVEGACELMAPFRQVQVSVDKDAASDEWNFSVASQRLEQAVCAVLSIAEPKQLVELHIEKFENAQAMLNTIEEQNTRILCAADSIFNPTFPPPRHATSFRRHRPWILLTFEGTLKRRKGRGVGGGGGGGGGVRVGAGGKKDGSGGNGKEFAKERVQSLRDAVMNITMSSATDLTNPLAALVALTGGVVGVQSRAKYRRSPLMHTESSHRAAGSIVADPREEIRGFGPSLAPGKAVCIAIPVEPPGAPSRSMSLVDSSDVEATSFLTSSLGVKGSKVSVIVGDPLLRRMLQAMLQRLEAKRIKLYADVHRYFEYNKTSHHHSDDFLIVDASVVFTYPKWNAPVITLYGVSVVKTASPGHLYQPFTERDIEIAAQQVLCENG